MLQGDFFTISTMVAEGSSAKLILELNPSHIIFKGHFPGTPVVPGVCMMQMVQEIMEEISGSTMLLIKADQMKFLSVVNPLVKNILYLEIKYKETEDGSIHVSANISNDELVCFKFKGLFIKG